MGSGPSVDTSNKKIVIIGGGYGGAFLAHKLVTKEIGQVKLIEPKEGMFHSIGALRTAVDGRKLNFVYGDEGCKLVKLNFYV